MGQKTKITPARFGDKFKHIITSDGQRVGLDHPRVRHVLPLDFSPYTLEFLSHAFRRRGWHVRYGEPTSAETLQQAKRLTNGRECLPCAAIIGETYIDLKNRREPGEISIYYNLDQDGPCQNGVWPLMWQTFLEREQLEDVLFCAWWSQRNNYLGQGDLFAVDIGLACMVGDLLDEAEFTLRCLAQDREQAMEVFHRESQRVTQSGARGYRALEAAFRRWAREVRRIPLRASVAETPKVLLFGGANLVFSHYPISDYFIEQGIIPKLVDFTEFLLFLESEDVTRYGFKTGRVRDGEQLRVLPLIASLFNPRHSTAEGIQALRCRAHLAALDLLLKRLRKLATPSGLLFDSHIPFAELYREGARHVSPNGFTETHLNTGRFAASARRDDTFDGYVNVGSFNCQPAMNTQACVAGIVHDMDVPYTSIDCEGPFISANQRRLLETVAVQAWRRRRTRGGSAVPVGQPAAAMAS